jgi:deoxyadenosine/deoxycytidine kinase
MGKVAAIVGNSGAGKTTLTRRLCEAGAFASGLEEHEERPYQRLFARGSTSFALSNQIDYLLLRAEQERRIRQGTLTGLIDGGLEMDYFVFTRRFYGRGYLDEAGFQLCSRLYGLIRELLPPPDLFIWLTVPPEIAAARRKSRSRELDIVTLEDLADLEEYLQAWLESYTAAPVLKIDASQEDPTFSALLPDLLERLKALE